MTDYGPTIAPTDELLTLPQVARELGITRPTAAMWAARGYFPSREIAGRTVVRRADLDAFKAAGGRAGRVSPLEAEAERLRARKALAEAGHATELENYVARAEGEVAATITDGCDI